MLQLKSFFLLISLFVLTSLKLPQQEVIRVACVGDSITFGSGINKRDQNSYPAQLQKLLGDGWQVQNFGVSGATMLKNGDKPYWELDAFQQAKDFAPDVVIIKLGTNDSKPQNWKYGSEFTADYRDMVQQFKKLGSQPDVWICLPAPVFEDRFGITATVVDDEILPAVKQVSRVEQVRLINLYRPLKKKSEMFPDGIHPDAQGARVMAETIAKKLKKASS
jgi:lysophospholipase L1-like esterase